MPIRFSTWSGILPPVLLIAIHLSAMITLALSAALGIQLSAAPIDPDWIANGTARLWSTGHFLFYSITVPFLSVLHATFDLIAICTQRLHMVYTLTASALFLCGWAVQVGFWTQCDIPENLDTTDMCMQSFIQRDPRGGYDLLGINEGLATSKVAFGFIVLFLYAAYLIVVAVALSKQRKRKHGAATPPDQDGFELGKD
ncbi:MAG: hypothetical protein Q9220_007798 [cf. Caloplaca sp. 1 TL-2023]